MSALEIVLVSVCSLLVFILVSAFILAFYYKSFIAVKEKDFLLFDKSVREGSTVFLGDSLTDLYPVEEFYRPREIINRGISGDTTAHVLERLDEVIALKPKNVFLQIGVNDLIHTRLTIRTIFDRISEIAFRLKEGGANVYLITLYPVNPKKNVLSHFILLRANNRKINELNALLKTFSDKHCFELIDMHTQLLDSDYNLKKEFTIEGLHISAKGYERITSVLKPYIESSEKA